MSNRRSTLVAALLAVVVAFPTVLSAQSYPFTTIELQKLRAFLRATAPDGSIAAGTQASLGTNLITNGDFATADCTGWTCGAGWDAATSAAVHTAGNVAALSQSVTVTTGVTYQVGFTQAGTPAGTLAFSLGAATYAAGKATDAALYQPSITALATGAVTFSITPDTNYNGTLDNITLKPITAATAVEVAGNASYPPTSTGSGVDSNLFLGTDAGSFTHYGHGNVGLGYKALGNLSTGSGNTVVGYNSALAVAGGFWNNLVGAQTLSVCQGCYGNNGIGYNVLADLTTGYQNMAIGTAALGNATTGYQNVAIGSSAMATGVMVGYGNVAIGNEALLNGTDATYNVTIGDKAGDSITTGDFNVAIGGSALQASTIYASNTCVGSSACYALAASSNVAIGRDAYSGAAAAGNFNTCIGQESCYKSGAAPATANTMTTASNNTFVGYEAGLGSVTQRTNAGCIGYQCYVDADNTFAIGDENTTSILASADGGATVTAAAIKIGANTGISGTVVVKGSDGNNCNLVFEGGVLTSETCP